MPVSDDQIQLLRKQQFLVDKLKTVLATQQRTLASLGAAEDDYENANPEALDGGDSDNEGEIDRLVADVDRAQGKRQRYVPLSDEARQTTNQDWTAAEAESEEERGFMSVKPWLGAMAKPSDWDWNASKERDDAPAVALELEAAQGYRARSSRSNVAYVDQNTIVYPVAALGVVMDTETKQQKFFKHHDDDVLCLDYNPTRRLCATGQQGKRATVCVWSVDDPSTPVAVFTGHKRAVVSVQLSPDGRQVASVGLDDDHTIMIHDIDTKQRVAAVEGDSNRVLGVYWNRTAAADSSKELVSVGVKHIRFWTLAGGRLEAKKGLLGRRGKYQAFLDCDFTPDHTLIATESGDVYCFDGNKLKNTLHAHNGAVFAVCSDLQANHLITGGRDGFINVWDRQSWKNVATFDLNSVDPGEGLNSIKALKLRVGDEPRLLIGCITSSIYELTLSRGLDSLRVVMAGHYGDLRRKDSYGELWGLATHPTDPNTYATCAEDGTVRIWNLKAQTTVARQQFKKARCITYSPDGKLLAVGFTDGTMSVLNAVDLSQICRYRKHRKPILCLSFSPDSAYLAVGCQQRCVDLYAVKGAGDDVKFITRMTGPTSNVLSVDFTADSAYLQVSTQAYELLYFEIASRKFFGKSRDLKDAEYATFTSTLGWPVQGIWAKEADGSDINAVNKSRGGSLCVTADDDGAVRVFNYPCVGSGLDRRGHLGRRPDHVAGNGHSEHVTKAAFTADDSHIVSTGGADNAILQWRVVNKQ